MQVNLSARHGNLSDETRQRIDEKVRRLPRLYDRLTAVDVTVDLEHVDKPQVEVCVSVERHHDFVAAETAPNVLAALDGAVHKLEQQLRRHKDRVTDRRAPGVKRLPAAEPETPGE